MRFVGYSCEDSCAFLYTKLVKRRMNRLPIDVFDVIFMETDNHPVRVLPRSDDALAFVYEKLYNSFLSN